MSNHQQKTPEEPIYRSGAVARLTGIPVQTLRVWERRYKIVGPRQSTSGQRLYAPAEVARLAVIKQLVDSGHAIGSIAMLGIDQLRAMLDQISHATPTPPRHAGQVTTGARIPVRVAIVGEALSLRVAHHQLTALQVVGTSPNVALAGEVLRGVTSDVLLIEFPTLQRETLQTIRSLAQQLCARRIVVEYGFGSQRNEQEMRALGWSLVHAPLDIEQLESLCGAPPAVFRPGEPAALPPVDAAASRRFDNRALAELSVTSVKLNCECPHHIADLLIRLGNFETYSAECESSSPADAALHHYLKEIAGNARAMLEIALVRVAEAEGLPLPK
ncbi:MAG: MerR family transcriptional regulator [Burkholderiales bacterium]|nr:MerR family transcriptional regulator [Burkholderiales bacterium]